MKTQKTPRSLLQWIDTLDTKSKELAMHHFKESGMNDKFLHKPFRSLESALISAFVWSNYEGQLYWENIIFKNK